MFFFYILRKLQELFLYFHYQYQIKYIHVYLTLFTEESTLLNRSGSDITCSDRHSR